MNEEEVSTDRIEGAILQENESFFFDVVFPMIERKSSFLDAIPLVLNLVRTGGVGSWQERVRAKAIALVGKMIIPSSSNHSAVCGALWEAIETDSACNALAAAKAFVSLYHTPTTPHVVLDADLSSKLHKFVNFLRSQFMKLSSLELLKQLTLTAHCLVQVFAGAADTYLSGLVSDMLQIFSIGDNNSPFSESEDKKILWEAQVKTLTFIAFIGRGSRAEILKPFEQVICKSAVNLLKQIPPNFFAARKELLLSLRSCFHSPDLAVAFVPFLDDLFEESRIVGTGRTNYEFLRPLAVSALADWANAVKDKIPLEKLRKVVGFFTCSMLDGELAVSGQFTSVRIILNLIDHVFNKSSNKLRKFPPPVSSHHQNLDGSDILREVLRSVGDKFSSLTLFVPRVIAVIRGGIPEDERVSVVSKLVQGGCGSGCPQSDLLIEGVRELRSLVRTLLLSVKMIVHCLSHRVTARFLTKSDVALLDTLLEDSLKVSHLLACAAGFVQSGGFDTSCGQSSANGGGRFASATELAQACSVQEERDLVEQVAASVLVVMPGVSLADLLAKRIGWLLESIQVNAQLMALCNVLIQNSESLAILCEILYAFLASKNIDGGWALFFSTESSFSVMSSQAPLDPRQKMYTELVKTYGLRDATPPSIGVRDVILSLLKSMARQQQQQQAVNVLEAVVRPFVVDLTFSSIRVSRMQPSKAALCGGLLRYTFRLMGAGTKTQGSVRELSDLVLPIMEESMRIGRSEQQPVIKNLWLEIALTVPVRLKALIPHFEYAVSCLVETLEAGSPEVVSTALSVLESWVDGLTPDFLFPLLPGHRQASLTKLLYLLTKPPRGLVVHTTASGNNSVRACKILGKLGARAKFTLESHNVVGHEDMLVACNSSFLVNINNVVAEVKLQAALEKSLALLQKYDGRESQPVPVSLQEPPFEEAPVIPEQDLLDALNLVFTALVAETDNKPIARRLARGLVLAANSSVSSLVSERAKLLLFELLAEEFKSSLAQIDRSKDGFSFQVDWINLLPPLVLAGIDCAEGDALLVKLLDMYGSGNGESCPRSLAIIAHVLAEKLHACKLLVLVNSEHFGNAIVLELGTLILERCFSSGIDDISEKRQVAETTLRRLLSALDSTKSQHLVLNLLEKFVKPETTPNRDFAENLLRVAAEQLDMSLSSLVSSVDPDFSLIIRHLDGRVASLVLQMRPVPVLSPSAGESLHASLSAAIGQAIAWLEQNADELFLIYSSPSSGTAVPSGSTPQQQQAYLLNRNYLKSSITTSAEPNPAVEAIKLLKLTLLHGILPSLGCRDRIITILAKCLFSSDPEVTIHAQTLLALPEICISLNESSNIISLLRDVASRVPVSLKEISGLGKLAQLIPATSSSLDDAKAEIAERLFDRLQTYLTLLRERTYAPLGSSSPTWRAGAGPDAVIPLAVATLEGFAGLVSDKYPLVERLVGISSQLEASLPSTFGAGQVASPFVTPLLSCLCKDAERTADQILTKIELGKYFHIVAEIVSLKPCLGVRKALQDKCHQMSLMDTGGVLMTRTAAASLTMLLARSDPSYLWIQYCSLRGSRTSLIESIMRVWENGVATLTGSNYVGTSILGPGGILGPADTSGAVTSFEGRSIASFIMQFLRAPQLLNPNLMAAAEGASNIRVRLLIRLATSLALKFPVFEVSPVQDWFLTEAVGLTSVGEKIEIVSKSIDAFAENVINSGCKYALLRFLVIPQLQEAAVETSSNILPSGMAERLISVMFSCDGGVEETDEGVVSELARLALILIKGKNLVPGSHVEHLSRFLANCMQSGFPVASQIACLAAAYLTSSGENIIACMLDQPTELYRDYFSQTAIVLSGRRSNDFGSVMKKFPHHDNPHVWKLCPLLFSHHAVSDSEESIIVTNFLMSNSRAETTEMRMTLLELAGWLSCARQTAPFQFLANFFLQHAVMGPDPPTSSPVSPTLVSVFIDKCRTGLANCLKADPSVKLTDLGRICEQLQIRSTADVPRLSRQLVFLNRMLADWFALSSSRSFPQPGHLAHLFGLSFVSTDKSVASTFAYLLQVIASRIDPPPADSEKQSLFNQSSTIPASTSQPAWIVYRQIVLGIQAGLKVAANNTGAQLKVHALNPNSAAFLVTPFTAVSALIGVLRGFSARKSSVELVKSWLLAFQPLLSQAVAQGSRSLVLGLLPQPLHAFALSSNVPALDSSPPATSSSGAFAYPGPLQGAEQAVPSLLEIIRLCHLASDIVGQQSGEFRLTVVWLIKCLGPFVTFASPSHQTFSHLLNGLNFTVPQQSQKLSGGLSNLITVVQLSALLRHCTGIVGRWGLGATYSIGEKDGFLDDDIWEVQSEVEKNTSSIPNLSMSSALVGPVAINACCNISPVVSLFVTKPAVQSFDSKFIESLTCLFESFDGLSVLSSLSDPSVKRLLGFIPQSSVTCFPGSALAEDCPAASSKSGLGGLFAIASELVLKVLSTISARDSEIFHKLSACILIGCCSREQRIRSKFLHFLPQIVPSEIHQRLLWIFQTAPWTSVSGRMFLPLLVQVLAVKADDRVALSSSSAPPYRWFQSFISLGESDSEISFSAWTDLFGPLMHSLSLEKQQHVVSQGIVPFLMSCCLNKQSLFKRNIVCAILSSLELSLPVNVLVHCARNHGAWFEVLEILESMKLQQEDEEDDGKNSLFEISSAIKCIFTELGEKDNLYVEYGADSFAGPLMAQGRFSEARTLIENITEEKSQAVLDPLWIEANKSLSEWSKLLDVASETRDPELKLEVFGKSNEWGQVADIMSQFDWSPKGWSKLFAAYLALSFSDSCHTGTDAVSKQRLFLADMEASINRSFHQLVSQWGFLPDISVVEGGGDLILHSQEFVEFSEASGLVTDIRSAITGARTSYPTPKQLLNTWRDRLPDKCGERKVWFELLSLRMVIFRHIQQQCSVDVVASSHIAPYLHDYPWSLVKLASVSMDENPDLAQSLLHRFQQCLSRTTDAFNQELFEALKEQIKLYASEKEWRIGLNVLNCCAISNSNSQQAAEISWMQGRLISKLGMKAEAKAALLFAVNTYPMISKAWVDLGDLIWSSGGDILSLSKEDGEECLMAYMLAVTLRPSRATRLVPRMLLLAKHGFTSLAEKCKDSQPSSVWISWVPLLVSFLSPPHTDTNLGITAKALLAKLACSFPQAVFWQLQGVAGAEDLVEKIKAENPGGGLAQLHAFLLGIGSSHLEPRKAVFQATQTLEDLRYKRISKSSSSESSLLKIIRGERGQPQTEGFFCTGAAPCNVELPGNYSRYISVPSGSTLESLASSVKLVKVVNEYQVINGRPRISFIGSNGLRYSFTIGFMSDRRSSAGTQLAALLNGLLEKHSQSKQRALALFALQSVPLSGDMQMIESPPNVSSLEEILTAEKAEESVSAFKKVVDSVSGKNPERTAFEQFEFSDNYLTNFVMERSCHAMDFYAASKRFTKSLAVVSILDHLLGVSAVERPLNQWLISQDGRFFLNDSEIRLASASATVSSVPFRLTRNFTALLGERNMLGVLPGSMRAVVDCLTAKRVGFIELLMLLAPESVGNGVSLRLEQISQHEEGENLYAKINELVRESADSKTLSSVSPKHWLPWM